MKTTTQILISAAFLILTAVSCSHSQPVNPVYATENSTDTIQRYIHVKVETTDSVQMLVNGVLVSTFLYTATDANNVSEVMFSCYQNDTLEFKVFDGFLTKSMINTSVEINDATNYIVGANLSLQALNGSGIVYYKVY